MLANFTIGIIGYETEHLLECVMFYGKRINKSEDHMFIEIMCCYFAEHFTKNSLFSKMV